MDIFLISFLVSLGGLFIVMFFKYIRVNYGVGYLFRWKKNRIIDKDLLDKYKDVNCEEIMKEAQQNLRCGNFRKAEMLFRLAKKKEIK